MQAKTLRHLLDGIEFFGHGLRPFGRILPILL
jgi:hypothetical protein